jgi:hypothetical protein
VWTSLTNVPYDSSFWVDASNVCVEFVTLTGAPVVPIGVGASDLTVQATSKSDVPKASINRTAKTLLMSVFMAVINIFDLFVY